MIYLASPYSHPRPDIRAMRYEAAAALVAKHFGKLTIFSPIVYTHHMAKTHTLPLDAESWKHFNEEMMMLCDAIWVLMLPGWRESIGVTAEIAFAERLNQPIQYIEA
jgi:hypothetical protein